MRTAKRARDNEDDPVLPIELLREIFSYLPAKELCRLRCLCKYVDDMYTTDHAFSFLQSTHVTSNCGVIITDMSYLLSIDHKDVECINFHSITPSSSVAYTNLSKKYMSCERRNSSVLGCNNGLLVYEKIVEGVKRGLYMINPVTGARRSLPHLQQDQEHHRFADAVVAFDGKVEKGHLRGYQLIYLSEREPRSPLECHVYSSNHKTWKRIVDRYLDRLLYNHHRPILVDRTIYLVADYTVDFEMNQDPYIVAISIDDWTSKLLPLPALPTPGLDCDVLKIAEWGSSSSLCLVQWCETASMFRICVLEDPKKWRWRNTCMEVGLMESMGLRLKETSFMGDFTVVNDDQLVFITEGFMYQYGLRDGVTWKSRVSSCFGVGKIFPYANTLCLL